MKIFIDFDKTRLKHYINYYLEEFKILIKVPLKKDDGKEDSSILVDKFNISNRIYILPIN